MSNKEKLSDMLDKIIDDKNEEAQIDFKDYLSGKVQDVMQGTSSDDSSDDET